MKAGAAVILILIVCIGWDRPVRAADLEKEFLHKPWGAPLSEFAGDVNVGGRGKIAYYINPKQAYTIFNCQVSDLVYGFYEDKFFAVYVSLDAIDTYSTLKSEIQKKLGVPKISMESRGDLTTYSWKTGDTRIKMKYSEGTHAMKLSFYYLPIVSKVNLELHREMDAEPPEPLFPLSQTRQKEAIDLLELFNP